MQFLLITDSDKVTGKLYHYYPETKLNQDELWAPVSDHQTKSIFYL